MITMTMILLQAFFGGALAAIGFGVLYNITSKTTLALAGVTGGIGSFIYQLCIEVGMTVMSASFYGAASFTLAASLFAYLRHEPDTMYLVPALIPLVPGGTVFQMMTAFLDGQLYLGLGKFLDAMAIAGMLVFGMMVVSAGLKLILFLEHGASKTTRKIAHGAVNMFQNNGDGSVISFFGNIPAEPAAPARNRLSRRKKYRKQRVQETKTPDFDTTLQDESDNLQDQVRMGPIEVLDNDFQPARQQSPKSADFQTANPHSSQFKQTCEDQQSKPDSSCNSSFKG